MGNSSQVFIIEHTNCSICGGQMCDTGDKIVCINCEHTEHKHIKTIQEYHSEIKEAEQDLSILTK